MLILMKIGAIAASALLFFFSVLYINNLIIKKRKQAEKKKKAKISEEDEIDRKLEPGVEKLSAKARKRYLGFKEAFPKYNIKKYRLLKFALGSFLFFLLTFIFNFVFGIAGFFLGMILPDTVAGYINKKRINRFELQLVDGLTLISNALKSGTSFTKAIEVMVAETKSPLSVLFSRFLKETHLGASVEAALNNLSKREKSEELKIAVVSINIARQTGGNLSEILLHIADTIRERERIKGKVDSLTAQGKLSGIIVGSLPVLLAVVLYFIDPIMMRPLFKTFIGQIILLGVLLVELAGFKWINKIVNIDI